MITSCGVRAKNDKEAATQQGLRSSRIRGLLLVLDAASAAAASASAPAAAASTTAALPCLFTFGHISHWYDCKLTTVVTAPGIHVTLLYASVRVARDTTW